MMSPSSAILPLLAPWQARSPRTTLKTKKPVLCQPAHPPFNCSTAQLLNCALSTSPAPPGPCATHLPAVPKCSLSGQEQPLGALQIILGEAIEVPTKPTDLAPVGAWHVHLHLGPPIPQHLCREAGTGEWGKTGTPGSPRAIQATFSVSACPLVSERRMGGWKPGYPDQGQVSTCSGSSEEPPTAPRKAPPEIHYLLGIQALQRKKHN